MADDPSDDPDFLRQRRNVLVLSIVLILFTLASGTVGKVKLFDDAVTLNRASVLVWFAWVAIAYTVLRLIRHRRRSERNTTLHFGLP